MNKHRGFSLIELSASLAVGSVLMVLAMGMVHRTMRVESVARLNARFERTAARLSRQFRLDVHRAQSISIDNQQTNTPVLQLLLPNQHPISYSVETGDVLREQQQGADQTHRDRFSLPDNYTVQFATLTGPPRAVLALDHDTKLVGISPQVKLHVEAVVGYFLRLSQPEEASQ